MLVYLDQKRWLDVLKNLQIEFKKSTASGPQAILKTIIDIEL